MPFFCLTQVSSTDSFRFPSQVFRLTFGPKSFVVVSDAEVARYMLMTNAGNYTKGVLSEILDFVMGKGASALLCS